MALLVDDWRGEGGEGRGRRRRGAEMDAERNRAFEDGGGIGQPLLRVNVDQFYSA